MNATFVAQKLGEEAYLTWSPVVSRVLCATYVSSIESTLNSELLNRIYYRAIKPTEARGDGFARLILYRGSA